MTALGDESQTVIEVTRYRFKIAATKKTTSAEGKQASSKLVRLEGPPSTELRIPRKGPPRSRYQPEFATLRAIRRRRSLGASITFWKARPISRCARKAETSAGQLSALFHLREIGSLTRVEPWTFLEIIQARSSSRVSSYSPSSSLALHPSSTSLIFRAMNRPSI